MKFIAVQHTDGFGNVGYIRRYDDSGRVAYVSSSLTPLALSNLGARDTHLLEARLARCVTDSAMLAVLRAALPRGKFAMLAPELRREPGDAVPAAASR